MELIEKYAVLLDFVRRVAQSNTAMKSYAEKTLVQIEEQRVFESANLRKKLDL